MNLTYPVDALVSYHYYKKDDLMAALTKPGHLRLIGDSGAFSAYTQGQAVDIGEYAAWCKRWRDHLAWVAALDVIGDPEATFRNWAVFRDQYGIDSVPTLHAGGDPKWLDTYAAEGVDYVGLGGLVGIAQRAFRWIVHVMRYARDRHPQMRFHAWGVTNRRVLDSLPVYSADSSGIMGQAYRYGRLRVFDPTTHRDIMIHLNGKDAYQHGALLERVYGVTPGQIARSVPANRGLLIQMAAAATQQYAAWLQARHNVTPPVWGINGTISTGPRLHLIGNSGGTRDDLNRIADPDLDTHTHTHVADGSEGASGGHGEGQPDLHLRQGPCIHVVDAAPDKLGALAPGGERESKVGSPRPPCRRIAPEPDGARLGPRIHLVDTGPSMKGI